MTLLRLTKAHKEDLADINRLLLQLSSSGRQLAFLAFRKIFSEKNIHLVVLRDKKKIIGMGTLIIMPTTTGLRSRIEDVVVDSEYRGQGLGEKLTKHLMGIAKKNKVSVIELSSRPSRVAANNLYQKLGFEQKETNSYVLKLE